MSDIIMSQIEEILSLDKHLKEELNSHLRQKAHLSSEFNRLTKTEKDLIDRLKNFKEQKKTKKDVNVPKHDINQFLQMKNKLEEELKNIRHETSNLEEQLTLLKTESNIIDSKIKHLEQEKTEQQKATLEEKQKHLRSKRANIKLKNAREKMKKVNNRFTQQETIKKNLESFYKTLTDIQQVISNYSPLSEGGSKLPDGISTDIQDDIITSKTLFDQAQMKYSANDVTPFLIDAQKAYEMIVLIFITLCPELPLSLLDQDFSSQVFSLVNKGLILNTRHVNAVETMLKKLEKGVEIAPLASFANEIKKYFIENLTYLRITGWVLLDL